MNPLLDCTTIIHYTRIGCLTSAYAIS